MINWEIGEEYLFGKTANFKYTTKIASFDLDGTITITKSKQKHPISSDDWDWYNPVVPNKIKDLIKQNYCFIIVSNQGGLKGNLTVVR